MTRILISEGEQIVLKGVNSMFEVYDEVKHSVVAGDWSIGCGLISDRLAVSEAAEANPSREYDSITDYNNRRCCGVA